MNWGGPARETPVNVDPPLVEHVWQSEGGERRRALMMRPRREPKALFVELHGSGLDPERQHRTSGLANHLWQEDWALLMPQAAIPFQLLPDLDPGFAWNIPGAALPGERDTPSDGPDDLAWIAALTAWFQEDIAAPDVPLFLVGYSGGARLASHLMVRGDTDWRAAGLVAGLRFVADGRVPPPPLVALHGMADAMNDYAGGDTSRWNLGVEETAALVATARGCRTTPDLERDATGCRRVFRDDNGVTGLIQYSLAGAGHAWMGSADPVHRAMFGPCVDGIDASRTIMTFFRSQLQDARARSVRHAASRPEHGGPAGIG